jgi:putative ABC transport system permease protein
MKDYVEIAKLPAVSEAMATGYARAVLRGGINPEIITSPQLTGTAFKFLDVPPVVGRGLTPGDFEPSGEARPVTVLSFPLWQRLFNGDPAALGKTLVLDDVPHEIVGVMPPRFGWYTQDGLWRPLPTLEEDRGVRLIVRLKPGIAPEVAEQQFLALMQEQAKRDPGRFPKDGFTVSLKNYLDVTVASGSMRTSLILLLVAVGFLLLIVCTNVANLQLARGVGRNREMAVRLALGAGRGRLFRQLLTESVALSFAGGVVGVGFAYGLLQIIVTLLPPNYVPNEARITINGWVLAASAGVAVLTGVLSGLVPGWQCTRPDVNESLKDGGQGAGGGSHRGNRTRNTLVVIEVAVSVVLVVGAALMAREFADLQRVDRGFATESMLLLNVPLDAKRYTTFEQRNEFFREFLGRVKSLPGVTQATLGLPPGVETRSDITIRGQPKPSEPIPLNYIDVDYLATLGIALKEGRGLDAHDIARGEHVALVSEAAAKLWGDGVNPIGRQIEVDALVGGGPNNLPIANATKEVTIVGVVADTRARGPKEPPPAVVFVPYSLRAPASRVITVRTAVEPHSVVNAARTELRAMDPEQPMHAPITFEEIIDLELKQPRFNVALLGTLGGLALVLAAAGIYSVLSYAVVQRSREIGVRMALGASRANVVRLFLRLGARLLAIGLVIGAGVSLTLARVLSSKVSDGLALDPLAFAFAVLLLSAVALLACYVPARRAAKVDPMVALRAE